MNLPALREVGFSANRRLLDVQRISHDPAAGHDVFATATSPVVVDDQRAAGLRFGDPKVHALLSALVVFRLLPHGFTNRDLRTHLAPLLGVPPTALTQGRMSYDLRRLRLHGIIERLPHTNRYHVTDGGLRTALILHRAHARLLRPALAAPGPPPIQRALEHLDRAIDQLLGAA